MAYVQDTDLAGTGAGQGAKIVGFIQPGTGAIASTVESKLREEVSLWDIIPDAYRSAIEAGTSTQDVTSYINQALQNYKRVIVRRGVYRFSSPIFPAFSEQTLEFEDGAWFHALNGTTNGIAVAHGLLGVSIVNPGLIGEASSATGATGILWNSNSGGTGGYGSTVTDDMGGRIERARFKQASEGKAWSNFIHSNMAGSLTIHGVAGRGLYGTVSGTGYGVLVSGNNVTLREIDVDAAIADNGRHGIYLGDQCAGADVSGFRIRNFVRGALAANTGVTDGNDNIRISDGLIENTSLLPDVGGTDAGISFGFQGDATRAGSVLNISDVQIINSGCSGVNLYGYNQVSLSNVICKNWAQAGGGQYFGLRILGCDNFTATNFQSSTDAEVGSYTLIHALIRESRNARLSGGAAYNTGSGTQTAGVALDATGIGTPNAIVDRFVVDAGNGSFSHGRYLNPIQQGAIVYPKAGSMKTDIQTAADLVIDVSGGESLVTLDPAATSVLDMVAAGSGQEVTLICTGSTVVKANNFYIAGSVNFSGTAHDTITLVSNGAIWREVCRSVN